MKIMVRGKNVTNLVDQLASEEEVQAFYEANRDQHPLGEETMEQFNDRNRRFLSGVVSENGKNSTLRRATAFT